MPRNHQFPPHRLRRRLAALASITALTLGSLALAGCGNDDELPPMEPEDPPMEEPAQDPAMGDDPAMEQDPGMQPDDMEDDPMSSQEPMMDDDESNY